MLPIKTIQKHPSKFKNTNTFNYEIAPMGIFPRDTQEHEGDMVQTNFILWNYCNGKILNQVEYQL